MESPFESLGIIAVHGFPDDASTFEALKRQESLQGLRWISLSLTPERSRSDQVVDDCLAEIQKQDPDSCLRWIVLGHDIGGIYAWALAKHLGRELAGFVLVNSMTLPMFLHRWFKIKQIVRSSYVLLFQVPVLSENLLRFSGALLSRKFFPMPPEKRSLLNRRYGMLRHYRRSLAELLHAFRKAEPLEAPALLLCGKDDVFVLPVTQQEALRVSKHPVVRIVPGGHWMHEDQPKAVAGFLHAWIGDEVAHAV